MKSCMTDTQDISIKKAIFVADSLGTGGAERVISELSNNFSDRGIQVYILLIGENKISYLLNQNIKLISFEKHLERKKGLSAILGRCILIKRYVKLINPDIVFSFLSIVNIYTCVSLSCTNYKLIVCERNDPERDPPNLIKRKIRNLVYKFADGIVFQTIMAKNYFPIIIQKKSVVIPNPIMKGLPEHHSGEREKRIVAIGRLEEQKNYPLLIKTFAELINDYPDYTLDIFGEGNQKGFLEMFVKELGLEKHVNFRGFVHDVHEKIKCASMFVLTSDYEGMPNALMEAMALGLPCISSDCPCGGPTTLIENGENGFLFPVGDQERLYTYMKKLLEDNYLTEKISRNAVGIRENHQLTQIAEKWLSFAEETRKRG